MTNKTNITYRTRRIHSKLRHWWQNEPKIRTEQIDIIERTEEIGQMGQTEHIERIERTKQIGQTKQIEKIRQTKQIGQNRQIRQTEQSGQANRVSK